MKMTRARLALPASRLCVTLLLLVMCVTALAGKQGTHSAVSIPSPPVGPPVTTTGSIRGLEKAMAGPDGMVVVRDRVSGHGHIRTGHIKFEGTVAPGNSPGCITMGGNATFSSTAVLVMEIGGPTPCVEHDQISVANELIINGARLELVLINGFVAQEGQRFNLLDWGTFSGAFGSVDSSNAVLPAHLGGDFSQLETSGEVVVELLADGDLNGDSSVNVVDVLLSLQALTGKISLTPTQLAHGDVAPVINGTSVPDGNFNLGDALVIQQKALGN